MVANVNYAPGTSNYWVRANLAFLEQFGQHARATSFNGSGINCYLGEVRLFPYQFSNSEMDCVERTNLAHQPIYPALFTVIGTTFGGNGINTFFFAGLSGYLSQRHVL